MATIRGSFELLYFPESVLGFAKITDAQLRLSVSGLFILAGHPLEQEGSGPYSGELVFEGVTESYRTIVEYIGDPRQPEGFKPPREVVDQVPKSASANNDDILEFRFEGYQESPSAWVDKWVVRARSFKLEVSLENG